MTKKELSRRKFLKEAIGAGLMISGAGILPSCSIFQPTPKPVYSFDSKMLPTVMFGSTGVPVPRILCGLGSRFCHIDSDEQAQKMLHYALDHGLYYFDTAWAYDNTIGLPPGKKKSSRHIISEERMGPIVKARRKEIFLSTKVTSRNPEEAMRQIETSLKRLQTDHLDQLMIHDVTTMEDVNKLSQKGNLIDILHRLKEEGLTRFIGYSGHSDASAMTAMVDRGDFDTMLIAMNHWNATNNPQKREEMAIPRAKEKEMAVILMKVIRPLETVPGLNPVDLIKYALSLKGPDVIVLGMDSIEVIDSNLEILRSFKPMDEATMNEMSMRLSPFYNNKELPWMQPGYNDGHWS